jgi:hypothetical protein
VARSADALLDEHFAELLQRKESCLPPHHISKALLFFDSSTGEYMLECEPGDVRPWSNAKQHLEAAPLVAELLRCVTEKDVQQARPRGTIDHGVAKKLRWLYLHASIRCSDGKPTFYFGQQDERKLPTSLWDGRVAEEARDPATVIKALDEFQCFYKDSGIVLATAASTDPETRRRARYTILTKASCTTRAVVTAAEALDEPHVLAWAPIQVDGSWLQDFVRDRLGCTCADKLSLDALEAVCVLLLHLYPKIASLNMRLHAVALVSGFGDVTRLGSPTIASAAARVKEVRAHFSTAICLVLQGVRRL